MKNRNIELLFWPAVTHDTEKVIVRTGSLRSGVRYQCKAEMSMECASALVKNVRQAMHAIRAQQFRRMNALIDAAEGKIE